MERKMLFAGLLAALAVVGSLGAAYQANEARRVESKHAERLQQEVRSLGERVEALRTELEGARMPAPSPACPTCPVCPREAACDAAPKVSVRPAVRPTGAVAAASAKEVRRLADKVETMEAQLASKSPAGEGPGVAQPGPEGKDVRERGATAFAEREERERIAAPSSYEAARSLYREGLAQKASEGRLDKLAQLVEQYPESNRAATSAVQLAQEYLEREDYESARHYLDFALETGEGAWFKDGIEVAPQALFYLGLLEARQGDRAAADRRWEALLRSWPEATTHSGRPLSEIIDSERSHLMEEEGAP